MIRARDGDETVSSSRAYQVMCQTGEGPGVGGEGCVLEELKLGVGGCRGLVGP